MSSSRAAFLSPIYIKLSFPLLIQNQTRTPLSSFFFAMECTRDFSTDIIYSDQISTCSSMETIGRCRLLSEASNSITHESTFTNLHSQRTNNSVSGFLTQSMISNKFYHSFVSIDDRSKSYPELSLNFLPESAEIVDSTNQGILLCRTHRHPRYYVCKPTTKQWQRIPNPKTRYQFLAAGMIVITSNPLHYKIVRLSLPNVRSSDKEFYRYNCVRCELFDSRTWTWKQLDEVKFPKEDWLTYRHNVSVNGSLHWLTCVRKNIFAFDVNKESYDMFSLPTPVYDNGEDIALVEYEGKLAITCINKEKSYSMELWVMENYEKREWNKRHTINIEAVRRKEPYARPIGFYNSGIALMKEHDHSVALFNFKNGNIDRSSLVNKLNHGCFPFQSDFELTEEFSLKG